MRIPRSRLMGLLISLTLLLALPPFAVAKEQPVCPICGRVLNSETADYGSKARHTLARGATNTLLGWTDLIRKPAQEARGGGNVLSGLALGVGETLKRTFGGVADMLTFWTPKVNGRYMHFANDCPVCAGTAK